MDIKDFKNMDENLINYQNNSNVSDDLNKEIEEFEKTFFANKEIKKLGNNHKWFNIAKILCSIMFVLTLINFLCLFVMFAYHTFYFLTVANFKIWEDNFYSLLMPLPIINGAMIIINIALYSFFAFFCEKYDDNGKDLHLDAVSSKLVFFSRWNLILWVFIFCFYAAALAGLTLIFSNYQTWVWSIAIFLILILAVTIMVFSTLMAVFIYKKMKHFHKHINKIKPQKPI